MLSTVIVNPILSSVESTWYNDIIFLVALAMIIIFVIRKARSYYVSSAILSFILSAFFIFCYYRFFNQMWDFRYFFSIPEVAYLDIVLVPLPLILLLILVARNDAELNQKNGFYNDIAITDNSEDSLGYKIYSKLISDKINNSISKQSFAICINGKWGSGKTSFLNLLRNNLKNEENIIIDFNPWRSSNPKLIIKNFFEIFYEGLKPHHYNLSHLLLKYSNKLISLSDTPSSRILKSFSSLVINQETTDEIQDEINKSIEKINKRLIVFIDDLDRLDKNEIIETIRLIRNTANFKNTFFIVACDREYVISAIEKHNSYRKQKFLEKIFQLEIGLPQFENVLLKQELVNLLKRQLPEITHLEIENSIFGTRLEQSVLINDWLVSMRDVTRLANSVILNYESLIGEVDLKDFLKLEILRLNYPSVYEILYKEKEKFLETKTNNNRRFRYSLKFLNESDKRLGGKFDWKKPYSNTVLKEYIENKYKKLSIAPDEVDKVIRLIGDLFRSGMSLINNELSPISIVYPSRFNLYFTYSMIEGSLSENEFTKIRDKEQDVIKNKIDEWVDNGLSYELEQRFLDIQDFDSQEDFEKILSSIFYLASKEKEDSFLGFNGDDIIKKLSNWDSRLSIKYYNEDEEELKKFVLSLFDNAKSPYKFESSLVRFINRNYQESFPLDLEELKSISISYLQKYCNEVETVDSSLFALFWNSQQTLRIPRGGSSFTLKDEVPEKSLQIMKKTILNTDLKDYINFIISSSTRNPGLYGVDDSVKIIFGTYDNFEKELDKIDQKDDKFLIEFKEFWKKSSEFGFLNMIPFDFKELPVDKY